eukprot:gene10109-7076_t
MLSCLWILFVNKHQRLKKLALRTYYFWVLSEKLISKPMFIMVKQLLTNEAHQVEADASSIVIYERIIDFSDYSSLLVSSTPEIIKYSVTLYMGIIFGYDFHHPVIKNTTIKFLVFFFEIQLLIQTIVRLLKEKKRVNNSGNIIQKLVRKNRVQITSHLSLKIMLESNIIYYSLFLLLLLSFIHYYTKKRELKLSYLYDYFSLFFLFHPRSFIIYIKLIIVVIILFFCYLLLIFSTNTLIIIIIIIIIMIIIHIKLFPLYISQFLVVNIFTTTITLIPTQTFSITPTKNNDKQRAAAWRKQVEQQPTPHHHPDDRAFVAEERVVLVHGGLFEGWLSQREIRS